MRSLDLPVRSASFKFQISRFKFQVSSFMFSGARIAVRLIVLLVCALVLTGNSFASELKVRVVDPQSAVVAGARVTVYLQSGSNAAAVRTTNAEGTCAFSGLGASAYRVEVLAPGFAPAQARALAARDSEITLKLALPTAAETVVVSAERTPLPSQDTGSDTSSLGPEALTSIQPVSAIDTLRFLPGAIVSESGRRGGLSSLFVRGGDSRYNKVIVDGVTVNDPGGTFDFGVAPMYQIDRLEFVRGAESTLYGSDAMTSVIQSWTATGTTRTPELRFGAEGGTFGTARAYASLAGARGRFDYNLFGEQFNTGGQGTNDRYSSSLEGANLGVQIAPRAAFRLRTRHFTGRTGVQSFWNFNGQPLLPPDTDQRARQNNFLAGAELTIAGPSRWQHRFSGFEYHHQRSNVDTFIDPGRVSPAFGNFDFPFSDFANLNRAGFDYQGDYVARSWARTTVGYHFEDENGWVGDLTSLPLGHGLRRNHAVFGQEVLTWNRVTLIAGARFEHNESFGNRGLPRVAASVLALKGSRIFSGTRLRFAYGTGIKEPRLEESFGVGGFGIIPNPNLKAEENRSLEAGVQQSFAGGKYWVGATYFNNLFTNQIEFNFDPVLFVSQYVNINRALAHGSEVELRARPWSRLSVDASYTYTSTQVLSAPLAFDPLVSAGAPLLRRPRHAASMLAVYTARRWGGDVGVTALGRRADSDFLGLLPPVNHSAGYARVDFGAWRAINSRMTAYVNVENALNRHYEESAGYPALRANFRAGMRFRVGGE
jgi:vitamin B12 transporter